MAAMLRVAGKETLRRAGRSKTLHLSLSSSERHVRTLSPVVQPLAPTMYAGKAKITESRIVCAIAISDDRRGHEPVVLQQLAHQAQCCLLVAPGLNENVEHLAFIASADEAALIEIPEHLIEQDHRSVKQRIAAMLGFKQFRNAAV